MRRDGATVSLWQNTAPGFTPSTQIGNKSFDVLIAGGGITGITTALLLQKQGKKCLIAEANNLCFGTTGGTTAHINTFFDTGYDQIRDDFGEDNAQLVAKAAKQAIRLYKQHIEEHKIDCGFEAKNGFVYAQTDEQVGQLHKLFEASKIAGVDVSYSDLIPVSIPFKKALVYSGQAQIHPTRYVYALAKEFESLGGVIAENCAVTNVTEEDNALHVKTSKGSFRVKHLIWATHIPPGVNLLHFRCAPYRSYAMAVTLADGNYPDGLARSEERRVG